MTRFDQPGTRPMPVYIGTREVAAALNLSRREVQRLCSDGTIPSIRAGGSYLVDASYLDDGSCRRGDISDLEPTSTRIADDLAAIRLELAAVHALIEALLCRDGDITRSTGADPPPE